MAAWSTSSSDRLGALIFELAAAHLPQQQQRISIVGIFCLAETRQEHGLAHAATDSILVVMHLLLIYLGVLFGCFFEGEVVLISAVVAAHRGYSDLWIVYSLAVVGVFSSDCLYFYLGRRRGGRLLQRSKKLSAKVSWVRERIDRHPTLVLLTYRYLYGFRTVTPILLGNTGISSRRFYVVSFIGVVIWAAVVTALGYAFGTVLEHAFGDVEHYEKYLFGGLFVFGAGYVAWQWWRGRYTRRLQVLRPLSEPLKSDEDLTRR